LDCLDRAFDGAEDGLAAVFRKAKFWDRYRDGQPNERQRDMLNRLLDGFAGKLTSSKYAKLEKCSPDTALRDITELIELGALVKDEPAAAAPAIRWRLDAGSSRARRGCP
jgi:Fic family protein